MREVFEDFFGISHIGCEMLEKLGMGWGWTIDRTTAGFDAKGALLTVKSTRLVKEGSANMTSEEDTATMLTLQSVRQGEVFMKYSELQPPVQTFRAASRWSASKQC